MEELLKCQGLTKKFHQSYALYNLDFTLKKGEIVGLLGPSGSGKTTLMKLINGLSTPTSGTILINGTPPSSTTKRVISYLPEKECINENMKISELITYFHDFYSDFDTDCALHMLKDLGIDSKVRLKTLSKGTKEKVQLILVMSRKAQLYLLDEPIGGVDPATRDYILRSILANYNEDATILISTHLISSVETILDRVIFLSNGQITLDAAIDDIRTTYQKSVNALFKEVFQC